MQKSALFFILLAAAVISSCSRPHKENIKKTTSPDSPAVEQHSPMPHGGTLTEKRMYDRNGKLERLIVNESSGTNGSGGYWTEKITLHDYKRKVNFAAYGYGSAYSFSSPFIVTSSRKIDSSDWEHGHSLRLMAREMADYRDKPDPLLQWIIETKKTDKEDSKEIKYTPRWIKGFPTIPESYTIPLSLDNMELFVDMKYFKSDKNMSYDDYREFTEKNKCTLDYQSGFLFFNSSWMGYYDESLMVGARNVRLYRNKKKEKFGRFFLMDRKGKKKLFVTAHAIAVADGDKYSWIWVSEYNQYKLRNSTVRYAKFKNKIVEALVFDDRHKLLEIDYRKGIISVKEYEHQEELPERFR